MEKNIVSESRYEVADDVIRQIQPSSAMGTVTIADNTDILLVPSPSADPRGTYNGLGVSRASVRSLINADPLNLSRTRKIIFVVLLSICKTTHLLSASSLTFRPVSSLGLSLVSGFGGLLGFYIPEYAEGKEAQHRHSIYRR